MKEYDPFAYPPNYQVARIHQEATKPGKVNISTPVECPCCQQKTKQPLNSWATRSIDQDFKTKGGAVLTYFWLIKLYGSICLLVLIIYSSYLSGCIFQQCTKVQEDETLHQMKCQKFIGIWIVSNQSLFKILQYYGQKQRMTRIYTLRTITYVLLLAGNLMALYTAGRFKRRHPQPKDITNFSLVFKNVKCSVEQFVLQIKHQFPNATIIQAFNVKKLQPFYSLYNKKLQTYYLSLIEQKQKKKQKLIKQVSNLDHQASKCQKQFQIDSDRVILTFNEEAQRNQVYKRYQLSGIKKMKYLLGLKIDNTEYCQPCPIPDQIIWNNFGSDEEQKIRLKVLSVVYFFALIAGSYLVLYFCMELCYDRQILPHPWNMIVANVIMILMVPLVLIFRRLMDNLSDMRRPNTHTNRTKFIIITTVLFHFIYYLMIPTFYLKYSAQKDKNKVLFVITNITFNFLLAQYLIAYFDYIFCMWNGRRKKVENQEKPIGCQRILHNLMQYPRFPIEFKHIVLFKTYSLIILFAFESPSILFLSFVLLIYLYFSDKLAVYRHYRMEIISNAVQYQFLKIYSIFFSVYTFLVYATTQHFEDLNVQFYTALALMIVAILIQLFALKDRIFEDETILPEQLDNLKIEQSYKKRFIKFKENLTNEKIDIQIKQYILKNMGSDKSVYSQKTDQSLKTQLLS